MSLLSVDHAGAVTKVTLTQGARLNPLSCAMLEALQAELDRFAADPAARVLIIAAEGKGFCAGHDLREIQGFRADPDGGAARWQALFDQCSRVMQTIATMPKPVIAQVQGIATAAGCQLAASCDFVVACDQARFGVNGIAIGLFCSTPLVALSRKIPPARAHALAATGDFLSADQGERLGLVTQVTPPEALEVATMALAAKLAGKPPAALALGKAAFAAQRDQDLATAYGLAGKAMVENLTLPETAEGLAAFLEKRPPHWI